MEPKVLRRNPIEPAKAAEHADRESLVLINEKEKGPSILPQEPACDPRGEGVLDLDSVVPPHDLDELPQCHFPGVSGQRSDLRKFFLIGRIGLCPVASKHVMAGR